MISDLLVIVPSRGRPENARQLIATWSATRTGDSRLLLAVDEDDSRLASYASLELPSWTEVVVGPRMRMNPTLNHYALERAGDHFALGFMGDDHRPRTLGWDHFMVDVLQEMGSGLVYGNDLVQEGKLPTAVVMTSDIVRALGYFAPPRQIHLYLDDFWLALGEALQRLVYLNSVVIEHCHPAVGKAEVDDRYLEVNSDDMYRRDGIEFERWLDEEMDDAIERVQRAIDGSAPVRS